MLKVVLFPASAELGYDPCAVPHLTVYPVAPALASQASVTVSAETATGMIHNANAINRRVRLNDDLDMP
jgi:hypothetical protein